MVRRNNKALSLLFFSLTILFYSIHAGGWEYWRGPNHEGLSTKVNGTPEALEISNRVIWRTTAGIGHSSLAVRKEYLYTMRSKVAVSGSDATHGDIVAYLKTENGDIIREYAYDSRARLCPVPGRTRTAEEGLVYTVSRQADIQRFNIKNDPFTEHRNIITDPSIRDFNRDLFATPIMRKDFVIIDTPEFSMVFNERTLDYRWKSEPGIRRIASPVFFNLDVKDLMASQGESTLFSVETETGNIKWTFPQEICHDAAIIGKRIFLGPDLKKCAIPDISDCIPQILCKSENFRSGSRNLTISGNHAYGFTRINRERILECIWKQATRLIPNRHLDQRVASMITGNKRIVLTKTEKRSSPGYRRIYLVISNTQIMELTKNNKLRYGKRYLSKTRPVNPNS